MKKLFLTLSLLLATVTSLSAQLIFDQTYSARNFNTSPVTVSGLKGDSFDYVVLFWCDAASGDSVMDITFNSDTGTNYRNYEMKGLSSTASAATGDTDTAVELQNLLGTANPNFLMMTITGSSGDERYIDCIYAADGAILKQSSYWKNTANEINSMTFTAASSVTCDARIMIYRSPKIASQGRWQLMKSQTLSAQDISSGGTPISFTGLSGDSAIKYKVDLLIDTAADEDIIMRINSDSGSNYIHQQLGNNGGSISAANHTTTSTNITYSTTGDMQNYSAIINAESGAKRLITGNWGNNKSASGFEQIESAVWWNNTGSDLSSLEISTVNTSSATGTAKLYRAKNPYTTADLLPFQTIKTVAVSGDFSGGHTFTVSGDDYKLIKIEFIGTGPSNNMLVQFNSDTGSNYTRQYLQASSSTASAGTSTTTSYSLTEVINSSTTAGAMYIYPPSGDNRPILSTMQIGTSITQHKAGWWLNSGDNLTSVKVYGSTSGSITGEIKFSVLK